MCQAKLATPSIQKERSIGDLKDLKDNEICIDGVIYDLTNFDHPGGDNLKMFCGNDCTVLYKMIHPYHPASLPSQKLERVGKVDGYTCDYTFDSEFAVEMKREVGKIVRSKTFGTPGWWFRAVLYISLVSTLATLWVVQGASTSLLAVAFGISFALLGLNVQHDANHGAASKKPWLNELLGLGSDVIGKSKWMWCQQHWTHHAYTNDAARDPDTSAAEPVMIFHDYPNDHPSRKWYHPYQLLLFIPAISAYWLASVTDADIVSMEHSGATSKGMNFENEFNRRRWVWAVLSRVLHLALVVAPPLYHQGLSWEVVRDIFLVGASGGVVLGCLFSLSHNFEGVEREPLKDSAEPVCWYKSQVETSSTYGGFISGALTGGLNFQIEHHLFPRMSSAWYPFIAPTVRRVCAKHGVRYTHFPWIHQNILSFLRTLHRTGNGHKEVEQSSASSMGVSAMFLAAACLTGLASWVLMQPSVQEPAILMFNRSMLA